MYNRCLIVFSLWLGCGLNPAFASLRADAFSKHSPAGVVQLQCTTDRGKTRTVSLGGVLDTQLESIADVVLVAAHGLTAAPDNCVVAFRDEELTITRLEKGSGQGLRGDWAVSTLSGRFSKAVNRLGWYADDPGTWELFTQQGGRVSLLKFLNGETGAPCDVRVPRGGMLDASDGDVVLISDCVSMPGMSGAPALVEVGGLPAIMGLNVGNRYDLTDSAQKWRSRANVIRVVDAVIEDAIVRAITAGLRRGNSDQDTRRRRFMRNLR